MEAGVIGPSGGFLGRGDYFTYAGAAMGLGPMEAGSYSALALAYIGDAVYEVFVRTLVLGRGNAHVAKLHKMGSSLARASAQAALFRLLEQDLTQEELAAYRRGRNANATSPAKNAKMADYRMATGLEALVGYLYLNGRMERLADLLGQGLGRLVEMDGAGAGDHENKKTGE